MSWRYVPRMKWAALALLLSALGCSSSSLTWQAPLRADVSGQWTGSAQFPIGELQLDLTLTQIGDSISGTANARNAGFGFAEGYAVSGRRSGDNISLQLLPVEDATINVQGVLGDDQISGRLWFNADTAHAQDAGLQRVNPRF